MGGTDASRSAVARRSARGPWSGVPWQRRVGLTALATALAIGACARREPVIHIGSLVSGVDAFLRAHPLSPGQYLRADEMSRTATASYHLVQVRGRAQPHRHATHDLTVVVLRGHGVLTVDGTQRALAPADAAIVPRGTVHWFANTGRDASVALVMFTPPLDAPDVVPAPEIDSPSAGR
jgi:mannose-6-phosphate isomerase-like protein (cupin superfamily)